MTKTTVRGLTPHPASPARGEAFSLTGEGRREGYPEETPSSKHHTHGVKWV